MKTCPGCREPKPLDQFYGGHSRCKPCYAIYQRDQRAQHGDKRRAYDRERPKRRPNPRKDRAALLRRNFGMTLEEYDAMLEAQGGVCAICRRPERRLRGGLVMALAVDHDHETGQIRGLLCNACNLGLGQFPDIETMENALQYLKEAVSSSFFSQGP